MKRVDSYGVRKAHVQIKVSLIVDKGVLIGIESKSPEIWFGLTAICWGAVGICNRVMFSPLLDGAWTWILAAGWQAVRGTQTRGCRGWREGSLSAWGGTFHCAFVAFPGAIKWFHCHVKSGHTHIHRNGFKIYIVNYHKLNELSFCGDYR